MLQMSLGLAMGYSNRCEMETSTCEDYKGDKELTQSG
jgi:hypothetical protein